MIAVSSINIPHIHAPAFNPQSQISMQIAGEAHF